MKVTLITGASEGIGKTVAHKFAAEKHNLLLVSRNAEKLKYLSQELIGKYGIHAESVAVDLSKTDAAKFIFEESVKRNLTVDVLVNNAGIGASGEFAQIPLQAQLDMLNLNNSAMVALCHYYLPEMVRQKSGSIINVGSLAAFFASSYMASYAASKAFVRSFTTAIAEEYKPYGIPILLFSPGLTSSKFMDSPQNNNEWGKVLVNNTHTQTPEQVADEMIQAWKEKKVSHISGRKNAIQIKIGTLLLPYEAITKMFAKRKRKEMNL